MKKLIFVFLILLSLTVTAHAAQIDPHTQMDGMSKTWYQGYTPTIRNHTMTICLPLTMTDYDGKINVSITLDDPHVFLLTAEPKAVTVSAKDCIYPVKLSLNLERYRRNGDYPATITIKDENGNVETMSYIIRIRDGYNNHETMEPVMSDVIGNLDVGSEGSLNLTITNPTTTQSILDGEITVTDPSGEILMSGSNRVKIPEILPGKSQNVTVPMSVKANAAICQHSLDVKLSYRVLGQEAEWMETFTVPVAQAIRLEQGGVQLPTAIAGELSDLTLPLMNMGKGELRNVLVKLEMGGVLDAQSVLVGTMEAGQTSQAKLTFTPRLDAVGTHSGTVTITCEDAYGNQDTQTLAVTLTVDEPIPEAEEPLKEEKQKMSPGTIVLIVLCILMTAGLIIQGAILTKKIHTLEEERL